MSGASYEIIESLADDGPTATVTLDAILDGQQTLL